MDYLEEDDSARGTASKSWRDGLPQLAFDVCRAVPGCKRVLLHGSAVHGADPGDIDLAMIVRDVTDRFEAMRTTAGFLADRSVATGLLHTCFPIEEATCSSAASQYVRNVLADGCEL